MKQKIETAYAYYSSPMAEKLGAGKTGCYYVKQHGRMGSLSPAMETKQDAINWAESIGGVAVMTTHNSVIFNAPDSVLSMSVTRCGPKLAWEAA